jgi:hypothetical protein
MRVAASALVGLALLASSGCRKKQLQVASETGADDYGLSAVTQAASEMAATPDSPAAYRKMALRIEELRPRFDERVADHAELELAFLAIGPLRSQLANPPEAQLAALATTVWPTALRHEPLAGESASAYLGRLCSGPLASECKYIVPEAWPVVMSAKVWRRMKLRAREAYGDCAGCLRDPSYAGVLEDYDRHDTDWQRRATLLGDQVEPGFWPRAGEHAAPWSGAPLLELGVDTVSLAGVSLADDEWRQELKRRRGTERVLGIHLRPRLEVRILRSALRDAARAGWSEVALQVRHPSYPFSLLEYRLSLKPRGPRSMIRDVDTVQILVQSLDVAAGRLAAREGRPALLGL